MGRSFIPEIPGWVGIAAMGTGVLVAVTASALPERWQDAVLYVGVGLTFATVGGMLLNLAVASHPTWRGTARIVGSVLGVLPVLLIARHDLQKHQPDTPSPVAPMRPAVAMVSARPQPVPQARSEPVASGSAALQLEPVLAEVSDILNKKARPALFRAGATLLRARAHALDPEALRSQLSAATGGLEEVQTSLRDVQSRHTEFRTELSSVIGNTSALDDVISRLRELRDTLDRAPDEPLGHPENGPRGVTAPADQWIADCNQRIADLRKTLATAA